MPSLLALLNDYRAFYLYFPFFTAFRFSLAFQYVRSLFVALRASKMYVPISFFTMRLNTL